MYYSPLCMVASISVSKTVVVNSIMLLPSMNFRVIHAPYGHTSPSNYTHYRCFKIGTVLPDTRHQTERVQLSLTNKSTFDLFRFYLLFYAFWCQKSGKQAKVFILRYRFLQYPLTKKTLEDTFVHLRLTIQHPHFKIPCQKSITKVRGKPVWSLRRIY